ncbi:molybdopterin-guanine dinucleotide biosynthesis protein B [Bacillus sp. S/N-304-OC-R1]|uniref:molybdopterin-guanine dinucleotide biosynthesis protein B n=1 Tax=Bacillus sp. S/N-304-OC-R1 TaxID=2758034 RepID=UPI001C8DC569|nr:molybdopterin-guanine dinucleotide biosynthesis protein B [Bacillus sp. S/N-304-OC-R1]MBY0121048.1 molybdopterin-guanine dinucleotide biosynthesis protein B [Bacillus sp. S/N-304-OC-R1]
MAMVKAPFVYQVVGYQNSGKTTIVNKLIQHLASHKLQVATIKHHGHGGRPELIESKDSSQHISSGALASIVEGDGRLLLQAEKNHWTLQEHIAILYQFNPDIILIEGFKQADFPKTVILKDHKSKTLLTSLTNIKSILYWDEATIREIQTSIPCFNIHDHSGENWVTNYIMSEYSK